MHKKFLALLLGVLMLLGGLVACREETPEQTTTVATHQPGLNTTPSGFVGFGDGTNPTTTAPIEDTTAPTEDTTVPAEATTEPTDPQPTEPKPTTPKPTEPKPTTPKPTEPNEDVTFPPDLSLDPDAEGLVRFSHMTPSEKQAFFMEFGGDPAAFDAWLDTATAAFKEKYPDVVYDGSPIVLPTNG